jgi:two-component system response regulator DevR
MKSAAEPLRVLLVDDHAVVRVGLRNLINDETDLRVVGEAATGAEALRQAASAEADVVVLDLRLPDGSGVELIEPLKKISARLRVLVLTSFADDSLLLAALKAGADGYLLKDVAEADLLGAIRQVVHAAAVTPQVAPAAAATSGASLPFESLTGQERRVFEFVGRGMSNREVATATGLTEKTVRNYLSRVFDKLGLRRRSQLAALFVANNPWRK